MILGLDAWLFWLILTVFLLVIELATVNLFTVWFAGGTLASMIASFLGASIVLQIIIAVGVSGVLLTVCLVFKPFDKLKKHENMPTNSDRVIGQTGIVQEEIDNVLGRGQVKVMGQTWSAVSQTGEKIGAGESVRVCSIAGVKLLVEKESNK